jgi:ferrochelatase
MSLPKIEKKLPTIGILLSNTGSPDGPTPQAVRRFLKEFLADPRVINYPRWLWLPILHGIILNVRPRRSARLYQQIWTSNGSPIHIISRAQAERLQEHLAAQVANPIIVSLGMRYGTPSISSELRKMKERGIEHFLVMPLFPQYSGTTSGSIFDAVFDETERWSGNFHLRKIPHYFDHPAYIRALAYSVQQHWDANGKADRILLSYHGIPKSYAKAGDPYAQQCRTSSSLLAEALGLERNTWQMAFQSRFGPQEWLRPYTDDTLVEWGSSGTKYIQAICPGFSADCLETLYEIQMEGRETFINAGGAELQYIPALNDHPDHIQALGEIILAAIQDWIHPRKPEVTHNRMSIKAEHE